MLTDKPRLSKAVDIFTLGCLFYYISTTNHPYGDSVERQRNIIRGVCVATPCSNNNIYQSEFIACFNGMIRNDPSQRHDIKEVLAHPLFWSLKKRLEFIQKTSDIIIAEKNPYVIKELGKAGIVVSWDKDLDPIIMDSLNTCRFRVYNFNRTEDLLRVIRNQSHHYYTLADEEKNLYKTFPEGFYQYYHSKFPSLCVVVHNVMKKNYMHHPTFFDFF
ncbi:KEN domain-containing protein [Entamoeba marina]